jgi:hypothetical protein
MVGSPIEPKNYGRIATTWTAITMALIDEKQEFDGAL